MSKKAKKLALKAQKEEQRSYREIIAVGGQNSDWAVSTLSDDSDVWQNIFLLRARMRDLWKTNPYFAKYRELIAANVFGQQGIMCRMKIKEKEDRVVHSADEKWALIEHERRINKIREWAERKTGREIEVYRALHLADRLERSSDEDVLQRKAMVKVGAPDLYANKLFQDGWTEWQKAKYCDARGQRTYWNLRLLRLWACARDGDFFIRMVKNPRANKFGFTLQMINAEWCDYFYNATLANGNEIRMGIEYAKMQWGIGKPVAYYFIKRQPNDWQFSVPGSFNFAAADLYDRIPAEEIIHYARYMDADGTRPAPWGANTIPKARQLDQTELAHVVAARAEACKTGWLYSDLAPEGGMLTADNLDKHSQGILKSAKSITQEPGGIYGLPWGVKFQGNDPKYPNGNFGQFRKSMLQSWCAGMPGADYNAVANDLEGISFSSGRLGRLDINEGSMIIQNFDIDTAETVVHENWMQMALITGAIPLPLSKFDKFNKPVFQGRRFRQIDEVKEVTASALRIANKLSSRTQEAADDGVDWLENLYVLAEEEMAMEEFGMKTETTEDSGAPAVAPAEDETETEDETEKPEGKPEKKPKNGKKTKLANGSRLHL